MWTRIHIIPALVAYTATALAGVYGLLYLAAQRDLRSAIGSACSSTGCRRST